MVLTGAGYDIVVEIVLYWLGVAVQVLLVALPYLRSVVWMLGGGSPLCYR